ncbi:MAG: EF-P lysine aminoacylase EpmA [Candidatus Magasanikiibacteriota bacterium]
MTHVYHIAKNKKNLELRFQIIRLIREWFWAQNFVEVESPLIVKLPGQEPNLSPMRVNVHNERQEEFVGYLHTSPEYTMKKMLSAGFENIFYLGKCFRDKESFGGTHSLEFTMLEFYRVDSDMFDLMRDVESLYNFVSERLKIEDLRSEEQKIKFKRISMKDLWEEYVGVNLDEYLETNKMLELCKQFGYNVSDDETYEELFYRIFLNKIEANLTEPTIVYNYPAQMAALSKVSEDNPGYAERFEIYINGIELANAFSELTDPQEQLRRLKEEQMERGKLGLDVYDIDMEFIEALKNMPKSAGIALGVDRLVMVMGGCQEINNVITLPASELFQ